MQRVLDKLLSGRFLLTVACAYVFCHAAVSGMLDAPAITAILGSVFGAYFSRSDRTPGAAA